MKKPLSALLALILTTGLIAGACARTGEENGKPLVAVSILPLAEFVKNVGGDHIAVMVMVPAGADPHSYEPKPSQMTALSKAILFVKTGAGLEFELAYMDKIMAVNPAMPVVDCAQGVSLLEGEVHDDGDAGPGQEEELTNPHIWLSPRLAQHMVTNICAGLVQADPANGAYYEQNRDIYLAELVQLDTDIAAGLAAVQNRRFLVVHPAWDYFALDYNLEQIVVEVDGKEPSAQSLARLVDAARMYNIDVVFTSPQFSSASAGAIARAISGRVVSIDSLAEDYINNMRYMLAQLELAME
jgi:zinc transport system substrate-binding protein